MSARSWFQRLLGRETAATAPAWPSTPAAASAPARRRHYAAAEYNRLTADWITTLRSMKADMRGGLRRLRGASRSLVRDTAHGARFIRLLQENVVGAQGIRLQARLGTTRGASNLRLNAQVEAAWEEWGLPQNASIDGRLSWTELQQLAIATVAADGEALFRIVRGADNPFSFALQPIDPDQLDDELGGDAPVRLPNGHCIHAGVEEDRNGRPVAYWLWSSHPGDPDPNRRRERVDAADIVHLYLTHRAGQRRGLPWATPVLIDQKMAAGFQEAAVVAARFGASKMAVITVDPDKAIDNGDPDDLDGADMVDEVSPGGVWRLQPGENASSLDFQYPNTQFGEFMRAIWQSVAAGLGVAHASLTGDLSGVNYSSIRAGLLQERDVYARLQQWMIAHFHARVFGEWVKYAPLSGRVPARDSREYLNVRWQPRGWDWVDPLKDMQAAVIAVEQGFTTRTAICAARGEDFEENLERLREEKELAESLGVCLGTPKPAPAAPASPPTADDEAADTEDSEPAAEPDATDTPATRMRVLAGRRR